ncbi:DUF4349 domain-containing protein [Nocardia asteroides]|uniref:DUF4349 domain-containing protein n=1 Tax=Nocardia asteroides TaxID=1824 RepID=UPI001E589214|nr:DUF4349 domain-containing protein [Nocardia asteroides]UGT60083.1 DUF4349 domain-containing protein [Nocardia asteroides]
MRKVAVFCAGLLGLALLVGCGADGSESAPGAPDSTVAAPAVSPPGLREQGAPAPSDNEQAPDTTRKEVVTGDVALVADDPIAAAGTIADRVRALDGRVDSRTEQPRTDENDGGSGYRPFPQGPSASLTVRVPSDRTDAFVDGLGQVGRITRISLNRADVTMQWEDLDARIRALQTSVDRLRALIAGATNTADLIAAEQALSSRQGELDSLISQRRLLDDQVALSTLSISVTTPAANPVDDDEPSSFWGGIVAGWNGLVDWLGDAVVAAGKAVPWLAFLAVIGGLIFAIVRAVRRRRSGPGAEPAPGKAWAEPEPAKAAPAQPESSAAKTPDADRPRDDHPEQP